MTYADVWVEFLSAEAGGRSTPLDLSTDAPETYKPRLRLSITGGLLGVEFVDGPDGLIAPGTATYATIRTDELDVSSTALALGAQFDVLEGGRVVARGRVTRSGH